MEEQKLRVRRKTRKNRMQRRMSMEDEYVAAVRRGDGRKTRMWVEFSSSRKSEVREGASEK